MKKTYDVIVIGGGAAGMIAAGTAAERGLSTLLLEKNEKLGKKLFITGKGRCNITNSAEREEFFSNITKNPKFFFSAFSTFSNEDLVRLLNELGLRTKVERGNRVFPDSDKSSDVIKAFTKYLDRTGVDIQLEAEALKVESVEDQLFVTMRSGEKIHGTSVIISTGGISYPQTGSTGDGYRFAEALGHSIVPPTPSLVPLLTEGPLAAELQGLSLKNVEVHVYSSEKKVFSDFGEMLFTHFGLTGPIILSASFYVVPLLKKNKEVRICIDLKPALAAEELDKRILKDFTKNTNKQFKNALDELLPGKMIPAVVKLSGIDPEKPVNIINRDERKRLVQILKGLEFKIKGTRPVSEAIVTSGGVSIKEINPKTMESKTVKGLYFAGEVLDLDAYTGGFNLQIAFSTGRVAGMNA